MGAEEEGEAEIRGAEACFLQGVFRGHDRY